MRRCASCNKNLPKCSYTGNQYSKGDGVSRCTTCVHREHGGDLQSAMVPSRLQGNFGMQPLFVDRALASPFVQCAFRMISMGEYTVGSRRGQACVRKVFRTDNALEATYFRRDIEAVNKALDIVRHFNGLGIMNTTVNISLPHVGTLPLGSDPRLGSKFLQEPFIQQCTKFNSNTGWFNDSSHFGKAMQALSHFSYHFTGGSYLLCDLQGGISHGSITISVPVIHSRTREYGVTDLGPGGIDGFFFYHQCNAFCNPAWMRPRNPISCYVPFPGTWMVQH